jgi:hypothetical protein
VGGDRHLNNVVDDEQVVAAVVGVSVQLDPKLMLRPDAHLGPVSIARVPATVLTGKF